MPMSVTQILTSQQMKLWLMALFIETRRVPKIRHSWRLLLVMGWNLQFMVSD
jgi:hypothetical protein